MVEWFVRAKRGNKEIKMPCRGVRSTTVSIGSIQKNIPALTPREEALKCRDLLISQGWDAKAVKVTYVQRTS